MQKGRRERTTILIYIVASYFHIGTPSTGTIALLFWYEIKVTIMMIKLDRLWSPLILGGCSLDEKGYDMHIFSKLGSKNIESSISEKVQNRTRWIITLDYVALLLSCVEGGEAPKIDSICFGHGQVCSEIAKERGRYWHAWKIDVL